MLRTCKVQTQTNRRFCSLRSGCFQVLPIICKGSALQVAAEKVAWEASKKAKFELVTICPTFVLGPVISNRADATSILDVKV